MPPKPQSADAWVRLATRVPASLLQRVKLWCVSHETTTQDFITGALRERLRVRAAANTEPAARARVGSRPDTAGAGRAGSRCQDA